VGRPPETPSGTEPPYRWRTFFIWAAGLAIIFGVLFALRGLHIFPRPAGDDPEIVAAKATQQALMTAAVLTPRPTVAPTRAPVVAPTAQPATRATAAPTSQSAVAPLMQLTPTAIALGAVSATSAAPAAVSTTDVPSMTSVPTVAANGGGSTAAPPAVDPALQAAVLQAYAQYWQVRARATEDPAAADLNLESVMADAELAAARETLAQYRDAGEAYQSHVAHQIYVTRITPEEAVILDQFTSTSVKLDPTTKAPLDEAQSVEQLKDSFLLHNLGGTWKVVAEHREN